MLPSFTTTYSGYYHAIPRLTAALAVPFPVRWTPTLYTSMSVVISACCALIAFRCAEAIGLSRFGAVIVAAGVLLLPAGGAEVVNNITYVQWYVLGALVVFMAAWITGYRPRHPLLSVVLTAMAG